MMSTEARTVFLSYALQDAVPACRMAEALRAEGIEVWFDQNELRGGEAWDAAIRKQVRACRLFVPVISANTEARPEGYFRLEWKLADDRTHLMAKGTPFLVPVCIDDTADRTALVPEAFLAVQWMRLPGGAATPAFCAQVKRLLAGGPRDPGKAGAAPGAFPVVRDRPRRWPYLVLAAASIAIGAWIYLTMRPPATEIPVPAAAGKSEKSVAVLPLENLSPVPEDAFFTSGMQMEIIATLARVPDLRVTSRATILRFKDLPPAELAAKLGVANVLGGSVRRAGSSVRVQLELRRLPDEAVLWQKTYERELREGFALQDEIAADVAGILQARASVGSGARFMTRNPEAYLLYLKARDLPFAKGPSRETMQEQVGLCEEALRLDPGFVSAAGLVANAYCYMSGGRFARSADGNAAKAKHWAEKASALVPGGAGDGALAVYYVMVERDPVRALSYAENEARALPNDADAHNRCGSIYSSLGRCREAVVELNRALALDPLHVRALYNLAVNTGRLRDGPRFERAVAQSLELGGRNVDPGLYADLRFKLSGELPGSLDDLGGTLPGRASLLWYGRRFAEVVADTGAMLGGEGNLPTYFRLFCLQLQGAAQQRLQQPEQEAATAQELLAYAETLRPVAGDDRSDYDEAQMWAGTFAGHMDEALAAGGRFLAATPPGYLSEKWQREAKLAQVLAWFGRKEEAVALLEKLLREPSGVTVPLLRLAPDWDNLRDEPRFQALLADPRNSAPL